MTILEVVTQQASGPQGGDLVGVVIVGLIVLAAFIVIFGSWRR